MTMRQAEDIPKKSKKATKTCTNSHIIVGTTPEERRQQCLQLMKGRKKPANVITKQHRDDICDWCHAELEEIDKPFVGLCFLKTSCCDATVCTTCICAGVEEWCMKQTKSRGNQYLMPCLVCWGRWCIDDNEFPNNEEDRNYPQRCGLVALYWIHLAIIKHLNSLQGLNKWFEKRPALCQWLWQMNSTILLNCLNWNQEKNVGVYDAVMRCVANVLHIADDEVDNLSSDGRLHL